MRKLALGVLFGLCLTGCGPSVTLHQNVLEELNPQTVAVLPFVLAKEGESHAEHDSESPSVQERRKSAALRRIISTRLSAKSYRLLPDWEVDQLLAQAGLEAPLATHETSARRLAELLGVDAVLRGVVTNAYNLEAGVLYRQSIGLEVTLLGKDERLIAEVAHDTSDTSGLLIGYGQALTAIEETRDNHQDIGFVRLAETLAAEIVDALPPPHQPIASAPLALATGAVSPADSGQDSRQVGARFDLRATGPPGLGVWYTSGNVRIQLAEASPGRYLRTSTVLHGQVGREAARLHAQAMDGGSAFMNLAAAPTWGEEVLSAPSLIQHERKVTWAEIPGAKSYRVFDLGQDSVELLSEQKSRVWTAPPGPERRIAIAALSSAGRLGHLSYATLRASESK